MSITHGTRIQNVSHRTSTPQGTWRTDPHVDSHQVRVGDLCYIAIGQIVNRHLSVARYQPTACLVINSPVRTPALAEAVRQDWSNLTAEQHRESLANDALLHQSYDALSRLYFYYPDFADSVATKLLQRPIRDEGPLQVFIEKLLKEPNPDRWKALVAEFGREVDQATAEKIPGWLYSNARHGKQTQEAKAIMDVLFPAYDPDHFPFLNATTDSDQRYLLEALSPIPSGKLDEAFGKFVSLDGPEPLQGI
jgi:hypothetical protein